MDKAKDFISGKIVAAEEASHDRRYVCCRPGCGGLVYLPTVNTQRPHFRHSPGEATPACEEYVFGSGSSGEPVGALGAGVEDVPTELGLILDQFDGEWRVGIRLPAIPQEELGEVLLKDLQPARVEVAAAGTIVTCISALDLLPGVGAARVQVPPTAQEYRSWPAGSWPHTVDKLRWDQRSRGLDVRGTLFRFRSGEWTRLRAASGVHFGERLLVVAEARLSPPDCVVAERYGEVSGGTMCWNIWEVLLPEVPREQVLAWLDRLGHTFVSGPWGVAFATPPREFDASGKPIFWIGDLTVLALESPRGGEQAMLSVKLDTNTYSAGISAPESRRLHIGIESLAAKQGRIGVIAERNATIDVVFVERPSPGSLLKMLATTRRLRVSLGDQLMEAWRTPTCKVTVGGALPEVRVDLGSDTARARVTVWERGKRRSCRSLDARNVARVIEAALPAASRIEVDADNLGRLEIVPTRATTATIKPAVRHRLAWHDHAVSLSAQTEGHGTSTLLEQPRNPGSLAVRRVGPATLLRSRHAIRRRHEEGGEP